MRAPSIAMLALILVPFAAGAQTLIPVATTVDSGSYKIVLFGSGDVRSVVGDPDAGPTTSGSMGITRTSTTSQITAQIAIAGTEETLVGGFGESVLTLGSGRPLNAGILDVRLPPLRAIKPFPMGLRGYLSAASSRWATQLDPESNAVLESVVVPIVSLGLGGSIAVIAEKFVVGEHENTVAVTLDAGVTSRLILGDLATEANGLVRQRLLNTKQDKFIGLEVGLTLQFNQIVATMMWHGFQGNVPGFTDGQVTAGISIRSDLLTSQKPDTGEADSAKPAGAAAQSAGSAP